MKILLMISIGLGLVFTSFAGTTNETSSVTKKELPDTPFETRAYDKNGNVTQWYQHFLDSDGKEIVQIIRTSGGEDSPPPYESIEFVINYSYNADGNVSETYEFFGDGKLRRHILYRYDEHGNYIKGDIYDATGKLVAHEISEPEYHMYGKKRQK